MDMEKKCITVTKENNNNKTSTTIPFDHLVAADGGYSKIRQLLVKLGKLQCQQKDIPDDYRQIFISRTSPDGSVRLDSDKLHGWMLDGGKIRIITAPIHEGCVSGAIIFDKGQDPFETMESFQDVQNYFQRVSPTSIARLLTDEQAEQLLASPTSTLVSVRCDCLHVRNVLLLGDAAHAVSASAGQGCNSALQDVQVFGGLLDQYQDDWDRALPAYTTERLADAHAVSELSDYASPRTKWMRVEWILRSILKKLLPKWLSKWMRPLPMEVLAETSLSYTEVLEQTRWWIDRVKRTQES
jgi:kynurenine 3-monooxygenase